MSEVSHTTMLESPLRRENIQDVINELLVHSMTIHFEPIEQDLAVTRPLRLGTRIFDDNCEHSCYLNVMRQDDKNGPKKLILKKFAAQKLDTTCHPNKTAITKYQETIGERIHRLRGFDIAESTILDRDYIFGIKNSRVGSSSTPPEDIAKTLACAQYIRLILEITNREESDRFFFPEDNLS